MTEEENYLWKVDGSAKIHERNETSAVRISTYQEEPFWALMVALTISVP